MWIMRDEKKNTRALKHFRTSQICDVSIQCNAAIKFHLLFKLLIKSCQIAFGKFCRWYSIDFVELIQN